MCSEHSRSSSGCSSFWALLLNVRGTLWVVRGLVGTLWGTWMCEAAREGQLEETLASSSSELCQLSSIRGVGLELLFQLTPGWVQPGAQLPEHCRQTKQHGSGLGLCWDQPVCSAAGWCAAWSPAVAWAAIPAGYRGLDWKRATVRVQLSRFWAAGGAWGFLHRLPGRDGLRAAGGLVSPCKGPVGGLKSSLWGRWSSAQVQLKASH